MCIRDRNAVGRIEKGGAFVVYSTASDETQIVGLGGKTTLENRFFPEPRMEAGFGKVVTFANPVERLVPDQARFVSSRDLGERLARLGVPKSVLDQIEKTVKAGVKTRMPVTLAVTAKPPKATIKVQASGEFATHDTISHAGRAPASVGHAVIAPKSAYVAPKRAKREEPNFALKREGQEESEKKRLLQALSSMRPDEEE